MITRYASKVGEFEVEQIINGSWNQNAYILSKSGSQDCLIIDPGSEAESISDIIKIMEKRPLAIINTHGHYDHIGAVEYLSKEYDVDFFLHSRDAKLVKRANVYKIIFDSGKNVEVPKRHRALDHLIGTRLEKYFGLQIHHTPGHTEGSVCLEFGDIVFSGDTILSSGPGRSDLPGGNANKLNLSIEIINREFGGKIIYPGHGKPFNINT